MHPVGNKLFGRPLVIDNDNSLAISLQIDSFENIEADVIYDYIKTDTPPYKDEIYWSSTFYEGELVVEDYKWRYVSNNAIYIL
jgi:hypothetical protein